jgi:hypothetical protein
VCAILIDVLIFISITLLLSLITIRTFMFLPFSVIAAILISYQLANYSGGLLFFRKKEEDAKMRMLDTERLFTILSSKLEFERARFCCSFLGTNSGYYLL